MIPMLMTQIHQVTVTATHLMASKDVENGVENVENVGNADGVDNFDNVDNARGFEPQRRKSGTLR